MSKYKEGDEVLIYGICGMDHGIIKSLPKEDKFYRVESRGFIYKRPEDCIYEISESYKIRRDE